MDHTIEIPYKIHDIANGPAAFLKRIGLKPDRSCVRYGSPLHEVNQKDLPAKKNVEK